MSRDAEQFAEATSELRDVESYTEGEYLYEYDAVLDETSESVRVMTLPPELADNEAATDAFDRVSREWYNANTHPNIVSIVGRETKPHPWIAIDHLHELTLDRVQSQLTPTELKTVVTDTAEALQTLGLYNAVHGALAPDDILVFPDGKDTVVQISGFGLEHAVRTALDEFKPTPYTAPELLDDPDQPTEQTEVYGLGAITYFALTGQPPVHGANLEQAIRDGPTNPPSEYNDGGGPALDDAVMQALSTTPSDRQDSPHAFKRAFLSAFDPTALETTSETTAETQSPRDGQAIPDDHTSPNTTPSDDDTPGGATTDTESYTTEQDGTQNTSNETSANTGTILDSIGRMPPVVNTSGEQTENETTEHQNPPTDGFWYPPLPSILSFQVLVGGGLLAAGFVSAWVGGLTNGYPFRVTTNYFVLTIGSTVVGFTILASGLADLLRKLVSWIW